MIGIGPAVTIDELLWTIGTVAGLACTIAIPYFMFTGPELTLEQVNGGWLMAIVPPMVSAATGAALIAHLPAGQDQLTLALACYGMFGISLLASLIVFGLLVARLARHGAGPAQLVPTLWIGLGPLGQSITAVGLLAKAAQPALPASFGSAIHGLVLVYGIPVWGFAIVWLTIAAAVTIRTARRGLPFAITWWSFTFPVGTLVTGTSELSVIARRARADLGRGRPIRAAARQLAERRDPNRSRDLARIAAQRSRAGWSDAPSCQ